MLESEDRERAAKGAFESSECTVSGRVAWLRIPLMQTFSLRRISSRHPSPWKSPGRERNSRWWYQFSPCRDYSERRRSSLGLPLKTARPVCRWQRGCRKAVLYGPTTRSWSHSWVFLILCCGRWCWQWYIYFGASSPKVTGWSRLSFDKAFKCLRQGRPWLRCDLWYKWGLDCIRFIWNDSWGLQLSLVKSPFLLSNKE